MDPLMRMHPSGRHAEHSVAGVSSLRGAGAAHGRNSARAAVRMRAGVAAAALLAAGGAGAADLPMPKPSAAPAYDWSGFTATQPGGAANLTGTLDLFRRFDLFTGEGSNFGGFQAGYNTVFKSGLMVGVEADISFPGNMSGASTLATPSIGTATYKDLVEMSGSVRTRI